LLKEIRLDARAYGENHFLNGFFGHFDLLIINFNCIFKVLEIDCKIELSDCFTHVGDLHAELGLSFGCHFKRLCQRIFNLLFDVMFQFVDEEEVAHDAASLCNPVQELSVVATRKADGHEATGVQSLAQLLSMHFNDLWPIHIVIARVLAVCEEDDSHIGQVLVIVDNFFDFFEDF
jgi:hypothetical protein